MNSVLINDYFSGLQQRLCESLASFDGKAFVADAWMRPVGAGVSMVIEEGDFFERGGVNFSHVIGNSLPASARADRQQLSGSSFEAMGVSLVLHPRNPYCPTTHLNVRYLSVTKPGQAHHWWFGGGMDLTPYYGFVDDARHFHAVCKQSLDPFGAERYALYKAWCDRYFFLPHRNEPRGIGGIFFDDLNDNEAPASDVAHVNEHAGSQTAGQSDEDRLQRCFALTQSVGDSFLDAYLPIIERRRNTPYGERERDFQAYRRGRYVEFNLVYDRGTLFGLQSGGRVESILMSLPPIVRWRYDWQPEPGSAEAKLYSEFLVAREWL